MKETPISVADIWIESFSYAGGHLTVHIQADGRAFDVVFHATSGMKALSPEEQDLSHLAESGKRRQSVSSSGVRNDRGTRRGFQGIQLYFSLDQRAIIDRYRGGCVDFCGNVILPAFHPCPSRKQR